MSAVGNESSVVWDSDFKVAMFHTTYSGVFRRVLKRIEPDINFVEILEKEQDLKKVEDYLNSLPLESGIKVRLTKRSYGIYNIPKVKIRSPENAFRISKTSSLPKKS